MLPVAFYLCETWSLTLKEECRLRRIFGPRRDLVRSEYRRLHIEELYALFRR
jgi:hypothetical protein